MKLNKQLTKLVRGKIFASRLTFPVEICGAKGVARVKGIYESPYRSCSNELLVEVVLTTAPTFGKYSNLSWRYSWRNATNQVKGKAIHDDVRRRFNLTNEVRLYLKHIGVQSPYVQKFEVIREFETKKD